jgi:transcriptional regulator with XRE-family HTH domain
MNRKLDTEKLALMVRTKRASGGLRATAIEIGAISASTLSRIENGSVPDVNTFLLLCEWLEVSSEVFISPAILGEQTSVEKIISCIRTDQVLPNSIAQALIEIIRLAYKNTP